jgi:heat shock protein HslJ
MQLEQRYLSMFGRVASWKIEGRSLELLDASGRSVATFVASTPARVSASP